MKRLITSFLIVFCLAIFSQTSVNAQTANANPWDGPRWTSVKVTQTVWQWIEDNGYMPELTNTNGEWVATDYTYMGRGIWLVIITWGIGGFSGPVLGSKTLLIKNSGAIIN